MAFFGIGHFFPNTGNRLRPLERMGPACRQSGIGRPAGEPAPSTDPEVMTMTEQPRAVVLLSGGLDSSTALAEAKAAGFEPYALTVFYGQRHAVERDAARAVGDAQGVAR